jgi:hypothetical protein
VRVLLIPDHLEILSSAHARIICDAPQAGNEGNRSSAEPPWPAGSRRPAGRMTRFRIAGDGGLSARGTVAQFDAGTFPDGLSLALMHSVRGRNHERSQQDVSGGVA